MTARQFLRMSSQGALESVPKIEKNKTERELIYGEGSHFFVSLENFPCGQWLPQLNCCLN